MTEGALKMDATTMSVGLLMESVQAQQKGAEAAIARLADLADGLDGIVRGEARRAFTEELGALGEASRSAAMALDRVRHTASARLALWAACVAAAACAAPAIIAWKVIPTETELRRLQAERDALAVGIRRLQDQGGRIELRTCGPASRLCVRVERNAVAYGPAADYFVIKGY
jgi:hypothetical protein